MRRLARWSFRHRRIVVGGWLAAFVILFGISRAVGTAYSNNFTLPNTESTQALDLLSAVGAAGVGRHRADRDRHRAAARRSPTRRSRQRVEAMLAEVAKLPHVVGVRVPVLRRGAAGQISPDGTVAFATVTFDQQAQDLSIELAKDVRRHGDGGVRPNGPSGSRSRTARASRRTSRRSAGRASGSSPPGSCCSSCSARCSRWRMPLASALVALGTAISRDRAASAT